LKRGKRKEGEKEEVYGEEGGFLTFFESRRCSRKKRAIRERKAKTSRGQEEH